MELVHEFSVPVPVPVEQAWQVLTDVERIAPCLPGAELTGVDGDAYQGQVKIKMDPITAQYRGTASFTEKDEELHRVVLKASGRETRGQGNASATVTAQMAQADGGTNVSIVTDLTISGRVAQFGRGVMGDVSAKLLEQFVRNLETGVLGG
jgi:carbon monoxide dehydrogenase subunit G